jgi:hypothetical protein
MGREGSTETILGVNVAAGVAHLVLVQRANGPIFDEPVKIAPADNVDEVTRLASFGDRIVVDARAHHVRCVAFADPRRYNRWGYKDAYDRAALQVAASLALRSAGVEVRTIAQVTAAKSVFGVGLDKLDAALAERFQPRKNKITAWDKRLPALAVALHVASELWP